MIVALANLDLGLILLALGGLMYLWSWPDERKRRDTFASDHRRPRVEDRRR